jgi:H+/Cl- antiporter ClcA
VSPAGGPDPHQRARHLGDFTLSPRVLLIALWALPVGAFAACAAWVLLRLIGLITNLVFFQSTSTRLIAPGTGHHSPWVILLAPVAGGLVVGLMARFGSEKIRGHGMPEAIEAIITGGSRVSPRVALLKPVSAAVSIGSGGPFGAEGPIIMTGGALGSVLAQSLRMSADERKALLVAGAAAGMAATFNAPLASVLLAVELLLFEWRPRSVIPVVVAVGTAVVVRGPLLGTAPIFPVHVGTVHLHADVELLCVVAGALGGLLAVVATMLVYASEDAFSRLPVHWMWWPAIGGLVIGLGGLIEPRALGVGYDVIDELLTGRAGMSLVVGILVVKTAIWSLSLGSGTSGGVLAPVFMIGGALGALESHVLPGVAPGFWALVGLAAVVGGVMRSPLTGVVFPLELTHAWPFVLPLLIGATAAYAVSALALKRSVLTEKIARRGLHLTREYSIDPLEILMVDEVMDDGAVVAAPDETLAALRGRADLIAQWLYPVADPAGRLLGVVPRSTLVGWLEGDEEGDRRAGEAALPPALLVHVDDTLREVAQGMATAEVTSAVVCTREAEPRVLGIVTLEHLLEARLRDVREDVDRERVLRPPLPGLPTPAA